MMASKQRRTTQSNAVAARSASATPEYFVDLTVDTPQRRGPASRTNCLIIPRPSVLRLSPTAEASRASPAVQVLDDDEDECSSRRLPPKKRVRREKPVQVDETINVTQGPQINDSVTGEKTALVCPICLEDLTSRRKPTSTRCGHVYCAECIEKTLNNSKKCPKCQSNITKKSCIRIYF